MTEEDFIKFHLNQQQKLLAEKKDHESEFNSKNIHTLTGTPYNLDGFGKFGFDKFGYDRDGYNLDGYNKDGIFESTGTIYGPDGFDKDGYGRDGYGRDGYGRDGYNLDGHNKDGFDKDGYGRDGYNLDGYNKDGFNKDGYGRDGFNKDGFNKRGLNIHGIFESTGTIYGPDGFNKDGFNIDGHNKDGFNIDGHNKDGFDKDGYGRDGFDCKGYDKNGWNTSLRYLPLAELISFKRPSNFYELRTKKRKLSSSFLNKTKYHVRPYYSKRRNETRHAHDDFTQTLLENKNENNGIFPAQKISKLMYDYLIRINLVSFDVVIPVPNHKQNSEQISGAVSIGQELSKLLQIECLSNALEKILNIRARTIPRSQRTEFWNNNDLYVFSGIHGIQDKKILLVDDIITDGKTTDQCIYQLGCEGTEDITVLCAGQTM